MSDKIPRETHDQAQSTWQLLLRSVDMGEDRVPSEAHTQKDLRVAR